MQDISEVILTLVLSYYRRKKRVIDKMLSCEKGNNDGNFHIQKYSSKLDLTSDSNIWR